MPVWIIAAVFGAILSLFSAPATSAATSPAQVKWQQQQLSFAALVRAQSGEGVSFPSLYIFNHQLKLVAMGLKAGTGLFKHFDIQKMPKRPLPMTPAIEKRLALITPLVKAQPQAKDYTIVIVQPDKNVVVCVACDSAFNTIDEQLKDAPAAQFNLLRITVIRD